MFTSISKASPKTSVTTQFTADADGSLSIDASVQISVNNTKDNTRPVLFNAGDVVAATVVSSNKYLDYVFVPYSIDGVSSTFAVVTKCSDYPLLYDQYRNKYWNDFQEASHNVSFYDATANTESGVGLTQVSGTVTEDTASILDPTTNSVYFVNASGQVVQSVQLQAKPLSATLKVDSATGLYDFYVLTNDGYINKIAKTGDIQRSANMYAGAFVICADDSNFWVAGTGAVWHGSTMDDMSSIPGIEFDAVYATVLQGIAFISTRDGQFYKILPEGTITLLYTASSVGCPIVYKNNVVLPVPEEYSLLTFDASGVQVSKTDTAPYLPMYAATDGTQLVINSANTPDTLIITDLGRRTLKSNSKTTFATPIGANYIFSHYLADQDSTYLQTIELSMPALQAMTGPVSEIGTPPVYVSVVSQGNVPIHAANDVTVLIGGANKDYVVDGDVLAVSFTPASAGKYSRPIVIGDTAVDYVVTAVAANEAAYNIDVDVSNANPCIFEFTISKLLGSPISLSYGTLYVNGSQYDGVTPVKAGDVVKAVFAADVPCSMLTIADSQFALPSSGPKKTISATYSDAVLGSQTIVNYITVSVEGTYYLPKYSNVFAKVNGVPVVGQTLNLKLGDIVGIVLERTSNNWYDTRDTFLLGPVTYAFRTITEPNTVPTFLDYGTLYNPFPKFTYDSSALAVSGLTDGITSVIHAEDGTLLSVNGGAFGTEASVKNGDLLTVQTTVANFFTTDTHLTVTRKTDGVQVAGVWHIIPRQLDGAYHIPEGLDYNIDLLAFYDSSRTVSSDAIDWYRFAVDESVETSASMPAFDSHYPLDATASSADFVSFYCKDTLAAGSLFTQGTALLEADSSVPVSEQAMTYVCAPPLVPINDQHFKYLLGTIPWTARLLQGVNSSNVADWTSYTQYYSEVSREFNLLSAHGYYIWEPMCAYLGVQNWSYSMPEWHRPLSQSAIQVMPYWALSASNYFLAEPVPVLGVTSEPQTYAYVSPSYDLYASANSTLTDTAHFDWFNCHESQSVVAPSFKHSSLSKVQFISVHADIGKGHSEHVFVLLPSVYSELVWLQAPSLLYGAFSSSNAAIIDGFLHFKDFTITPYTQPENMTSYRVSFDYALHCGVPKSSLYPVAWLLGGG